MIRCVLGVWLLVGMSAHVWAATYTFEPQSGSVEFLAKGKPSLVKIKGVGKGLTGTLTESEKQLSGTIEFPLDSLDTGIGLRNEHMKEKYLETAKHPKAILKFTSFPLPAALDREFDFSGELELKGERKPVSGTAKAVTTGNTLRVEASFPIKLSDFKIGVPSFKGITVAEDVTVTVKAEVVKADDGAKKLAAD